MGALHPDLPDLPDPLPGNSWDLPVPLDDLACALNERGKGIEIADLAEIDAYSVSYHGVPWTPGNDGGTELSLIVLARLNDDRWIVLEAWNDYTGWGCQDGVDLYVGGLTNDGRSALGLPPVQ